jgi:hypothetical protein
MTPKTRRLRFLAAHLTTTASVDTQCEHVPPRDFSDAALTRNRSTEELSGSTALWGLISFALKSCTQKKQ